jgi:hypothetical protein
MCNALICGGFIAATYTKEDSAMHNIGGGKVTVYNADTVAQFENSTIAHLATNVAKSGLARPTRYSHRTKAVPLRQIQRWGVITGIFLVPQTVSGANTFARWRANY